MASSLRRFFSHSRFKTNRDTAGLVAVVTGTWSSVREHECGNFRQRDLFEVTNSTLNELKYSAGGVQRNWGTEKFANSNFPLYRIIPCLPLVPPALPPNFHDV